jgi:mono/diheme cytochrome c family protein
MIPAHMPRRLLVPVLVALASALLAACGSQGVSVPKQDPTHAGAVLFAQHCSGCHTLSAAGAEGSSTKVKDKERTDGPNFDVRKEQLDEILYAIRNGGFSGAIMPQNVVVGAEAQKVAEFLAKYSGHDAKSPPTPTSTSPSG